MPGERHVPMRRCVVCRTSLPKEGLVRFVRGDDGEWRLDARGRAPGRGTWICADCAHEADAKRIARGFRGRPDAVIDQLRGHLDGAPPGSEPRRSNPDARSATHDQADSTHDQTGSKHDQAGSTHDQTGSKHGPRPLNSGGNHG